MRLLLVTAAGTLLQAISAYKIIYTTGLIQMSCRFFPGCSDYSAESIRRHGIFKGAALGLRRLLKCHPWNPGGWDPVPEN